MLFAGEDVRRLTQESIIDNVGIVSQETYLFHATIRENLPLRQARRDRGGARGGVPRGEHPPHHRRVRGRLRHDRRRARLPALGRREAAHRDRARAAEGPAGAAAGRGDLGSRHRLGARRAGGAGCRGPRPHDPLDRAPALDGDRRRRHPRRRGGRIVESGTHADADRRRTASTPSSPPSSSRHRASSKSRRPSRSAHCPPAAPTARPTTRRRCRSMTRS